MSKPPHNQRGGKPQQQQSNLQKIEVRQQWVGPLPAPEDLEKFNRIIPDGAERILAMTEKEQAHRIDYEATGLTATVQESRRGQYLGTLVSLAAICGAIYTAHIGAHWAIATSLVGVPILGIIRAIVRPRQK